MDYLKENKIFKTEQRVRFTLSKPFECRGLMKKFFQCVDSYESKNQSFAKAAQSCSEFNYDSCLLENSKKVFENRIFNVNMVKDGDDEDEE